MTCHDSMLRGNVAHLVSAYLGKALQKGGYLYRHPSEVSRCTSSAGVKEGGGQSIGAPLRPEVSKRPTVEPI